MPPENREGHRFCAEGGASLALACPSWRSRPRHPGLLKTDEKFGGGCGQPVSRALAAVDAREGIQRLERVFRFASFAEALTFTDRVGALAEEEGHHPALLTEWGRVTVTWWTHAIDGLHRNDFIMAAKTDTLLTG